MTANDQVEEIARMWREQMRRPLPPNLPSREPHGFDLTSIDSGSAGCIDAFLKSPGRFVRDQKRLNILRACFEDIGKYWDRMAADEKEYFGHLQQVVSEILMWHARQTHGKRAKTI